MTDWTLCEDTLPEAWESVLVINDAGVMSVAYCDCGEGGGDPVWLLDGTLVRCVPYMWRSLPDPPRHIPLEAPEL